MVYDQPEYGVPVCYIQRPAAIHIPLETYGRYVYLTIQSRQLSEFCKTTERARVARGIRDHGQHRESYTSIFPFYPWHACDGICLLIILESTKSIQLPGLDIGIVLLLLISEPIVWRGRFSSTWRTGLPCTPSFAITDYKSQSQTFDKLCLDIDTSSTFSSMYVNLSRGRTLKGVSLLRPIPRSVWNKEPSGSIKAGMMRLENLAKRTLEENMFDTICWLLFPLSEAAGPYIYR